MKIEVKTLMSDNEMLSHIFLGCIPHDDLVKIRDKFIADKDWHKESVKIPVELKIGGVSVNPKPFFDSWKNQMQEMIKKAATELVAEKLGSQKMSDMQNKLYEYEQVLKSWEDEINWDGLRFFTCPVGFIPFHHFCVTHCLVYYPKLAHFSPIEPLKLNLGGFILILF